MFTWAGYLFKMYPIQSYNALGYWNETHNVYNANRLNKTRAMRECKVARSLIDWPSFVESHTCSIIYTHKHRNTQAHTHSTVHRNSALFSCLLRALAIIVRDASKVCASKVFVNVPTRFWTVDCVVWYIRQNRSREETNTVEQPKISAEKNGKFQRGPDTRNNLWYNVFWHKSRTKDCTYP